MEADERRRKPISPEGKFKKDNLTAPHYNPRVEDDQTINRAGRYLKYAVVGGVVGLVVGLVVGTSAAFVTESSVITKLAYITQSSVIGAFLGTFLSVAVSTAIESHQSTSLGPPTS